MNYTVSNMVVRNQISPRPIYINITGSTGCTGSIGSTGSSIYSYTGPSYLGDTGSTGPTGMSISYTGDIGCTGDTGPNYIGDTGPIGYTGPVEQYNDITGSTGYTGISYYGPTGYTYTRDISFTLGTTSGSYILPPGDNNISFYDSTLNMLDPGIYYLTFSFTMNILSYSVFITLIDIYLTSYPTNQIYGIPQSLQNFITPSSTSGQYYYLSSVIECNGTIVFETDINTYIQINLLLNYSNASAVTNHSIEISNIKYNYTKLIQ